MTQSECQEKTCIILIGGAGCGKSTLTNILSKGGAITSNGSNSCTKVSTIYSVDSKTILMDTPGFDDSDNLTDTEIITDMTTKLGEAKSPNAKIIWCVEQSCRAKGSIQRQARLINALGGSIWKSVILICKKGEDSSDWQGATDSATKYNGTIKYCLGITNINCLNDKKQQKLKNRDFSTRSEDGKYYPNEIKKLVFNTLSKISLWEAKLKKIYHHASTLLIHSSSWSSSYRSYQVRKERRGCPRCGNTNVKGYCWEKATKTYKKTWYCRSCNKELRSQGAQSYHCLRCCCRSKNHANGVLRVGCSGVRCASCSYTSYYVTKYEGAYSCCGSKSSIGCVTYCCRKNPNSTLTTTCGEIVYKPQNL